ncbi:MAG: gamma-glutamyltransferase [Candidatus Heimdallarchaeaceae archaeon]
MKVLFNSRRSVVYSKNGMVATSQPLASEIGIEILRQGGNAADAAVAIAAALNVTEPCSTGIGGDMFCLFYNDKTKTIQGINGSGRAPADLSIEKLEELGITGQVPPFSVHAITVPGAAAGWIDTLEMFGTMSLREVLTPAIKLAEDGFPVAPITARAWKVGEKQLKIGPYGDELLTNGHAPKAGQIMKNSNLAQTFKALIEHGKAGFYEGRIAESIIDLIQSMGGVMTLEDLKNHRSTVEKPISTNYKGIDIWEIPPNGQGITALIALNILEEYDISQFEHSSAQHLHLLIESLRLAFADTRWYVADPAVVEVPTKQLLSKEYAKKRRQLINLKKSNLGVKKGYPITNSDTVYFCVVDKEGNACSFINSNYMGFGTGLVPKGCGFTLQNRGANFSLNKEHPNKLEPNKRPYHTIIPGMMTIDGELFGPFGVMGGFMQPQGHVQVVVNMVDYGMNPQEALDAPRFCIIGGDSAGKVALEEGIKVEVMSQLVDFGHNVVPTSGHRRAVFGRGQIIIREPETGVLSAGSDPRADGMAIGF